MNMSKGPDSAEDLDFDRRTFHYRYWIGGCGIFGLGLGLGSRQFFYHETRVFGKWGKEWMGRGIRKR